jgi:hypothetical protein
MNILLWVLQIALALLNLAGGAYKVFSGAALAKQFSLPSGVWAVLGLIEVVGGVLVVVPAALNWMPELTPLAAAVLAVEALVLVALYARKSLRLTAANPLPYALVMALLAAFVAYGRYALNP